LLLIAALLGSISLWIVGFRSVPPFYRLAVNILFLAALAGSAAVVHGLTSASGPMPALRLEVLPPSDTPGTYFSEKTHKLVLTKDKQGSAHRIRCALRIENTGSRPASRLLLTFFFRDKNPSEDESAGRLVVDYNRDKQHHIQSTLCEVNVRGGTPIGYTLLLDEGLIVYPDPVDKRIVAELELIAKTEYFSPDFEIRYRIHSMEGNSCLGERKNERTGPISDQVYDIHFEKDRTNPSK